MTGKSALSMMLLVLWTGAGLMTAPVAADPPDFSGTWVMNVHGSELAGERPPMSKVQRVEHQGTELVVTIDEIGDRGTVHGVARYATDGQDSINDVLGSSMTSSIGWEGPVMIMRTWGRFGNADIVLVDRWSLSPDGKTLTIARQFRGHGRVADQTLVFERK